MVTHSPAPPRWITRRRPERFSAISDYELIAREIGQPLMPWQHQVLDIAGELLTEAECRKYGVPIGTPAYRELWITVMRQSGKTTVVVITLADRCIDPSRRWEAGSKTAANCLYTAQNGRAARRKLLAGPASLLKVLQSSKSIDDRIVKVLRGVGQEEIRFRSGATIVPGNNTESAVHGETLDFGVIDEAFDDIDDRREQAMNPAMATKPMAQILGVSTMGTAASLYLNRKVEIGRQAVLEDRGRGIAYAEWSAPEDADTYDEKIWLAHHPALNRTIPIEVMRHAAQTMGEAEFRRAWLNIPTELHNGQHIPGDRWADACGEYRAFPDGGDLAPKVIAVDVSEDRSRTSIALGNAETSTVQLADCNEGTAWVDDRIETIKAKAGGPCVVVYDGMGPVHNLGKDRPDWVPLDGNEVTAACADFFDGIVAGSIKVRRSDLLNEALAGAEVRRSTDRWRWARRSSVGDISPLYAVTLAATCRATPIQAPFVL